MGSEPASSQFSRIARIGGSSLQAKDTLDGWAVDLRGTHHLTNGGRLGLGVLSAGALAGMAGMTTGAAVGWLIGGAALTATGLVFMFLGHRVRREQLAQIGQRLVLRRGRDALWSFSLSDLRNMAIEKRDDGEGAVNHDLVLTTSGDEFDVVGLELERAQVLEAWLQRCSEKHRNAPTSVPRALDKLRKRDVSELA